MGWSPYRTSEVTETSLFTFLTVTGSIGRDEEGFDGWLWCCPHCGGGVGFEFTCVIGATQFERMRESWFHWTRLVL